MEEQLSMKRFLALAAIVCLPAAAAVLKIGSNSVNAFGNVPVNSLEKSTDCAPGICTFNQYIEGTNTFAILPDQSGDVVAISSPTATWWETLPFWFEKEMNEESVTMHWEIANFKPSNRFGWYDLSAPNTLYQIFQGSDNAPGNIVKTFKPTAQFGIYLKSNSGTYRSSDPATSNQFALYLNTKTNLLQIGTEDVVRASDRDYNDMILSLRAVRDEELVPHPEPGTYAMLGTGLCGFWFLMRRRRNGNGN
jgi:hypothetical protein